MAAPPNVEMEAAKFLHKLIQESEDEPPNLLQSFMCQHGLDIDALTSSRVPLTTGTQVADSASSRVPLTTGTQVADSASSQYAEDDFRRRYRMHPHIFNHIMTTLYTQDSYRHQKADAVGLLGLLPQQKMTATLRMLAYDATTDQCAEICRMGESTTIECMKKFCQQVEGLFGKEYLRAPTPVDLRRLPVRGEQRKFSNMFGSIDCMHREWKNCPSWWGGAYSGRKRRPTIILEAVTSYVIWVWHAFFGVPRAQNDINVLGQSPVFDKVIAGDSPTVVFHVNDKRYNNTYYLVDVIYPGYSTFVKVISNPATQAHKLFVKKQEANRKDVERCFAILQSRWAILRHGAGMHKRSTLRNIMMTWIILHNMIVEDEFVKEEFVESVEEDLMNPLEHMHPQSPVVLESFVETEKWWERLQIEDVLQLLRNNPIC
ncbi:hypothetical protein AgCh_007359 [Apium graveolens]